MYGAAYGRPMHSPIYGYPKDFCYCTFLLFLLQIAIVAIIAICSLKVYTPSRFGTVFWSRKAHEGPPHKSGKINPFLPCLRLSALGFVLLRSSVTNRIKVK